MLVPEHLPSTREALGSIPSIENNAKIKLWSFLKEFQVLCIYLFIITHVCAWVCTGQCAHGSEGNLVESLLSTFMWVLGPELRLPGLHNNHLHLLNHLTCAEMFLLIRGLVVILKTNDILMV